MRSCGFTFRRSIALVDQDHPLTHGGSTYPLQRQRNTLTSLCCGDIRAMDNCSTNERSWSKYAPFALHALYDGALVIAIGIWAKKDRISGFDTPIIYDPIDNSTDVWHRPHLCHGELNAQSAKISTHRRIFTSKGWLTANFS